MNFNIKDLVRNYAGVYSGLEWFLLGNSVRRWEGGEGGSDDYWEGVLGLEGCLKFVCRLLGKKGIIK